MCRPQGEWKNVKLVDTGGAKFGQTNHDCGSELVHEILPGESLENTRWLFLGDSTMSRLSSAFGFLQKARGNKLEKNRAMGRCSLMNYMDIPKATNWIHPVSGHEGPVVYGLEHHFCTDAKSSARTFSAAETGMEMEFLGVEFARDVEMPSLTTKTTQETVMLYLDKTTKRDVCVVNTGLHDEQIRDKTDSDHVSDVRWYLNMLQHHCKQLVWLTTNYVLENADRIAQQAEKPDALREGAAELINKRISTRNHLVTEMIQKHFPRVKILDIWDMSANERMHVDHVHMATVYYDTIAAYFDTSKTGTLEVEGSNTFELLRAKIREEMPHFFDGDWDDTVTVQP